MLCVIQKSGTGSSGSTIISAAKAGKVQRCMSVARPLFARPATHDKGVQPPGGQVASGDQGEAAWPKRAEPDPGFPVGFGTPLGGGRQAAGGGEFHLSVRRNPGRAASATRAPAGSPRTRSLP